MAKDIDGCSCDAFAAARSQLFIVRIGDKFSLADRETSTVGAKWSTLYGPVITHCPFCGSTLIAKREG